MQAVSHPLRVQKHMHMRRRARCMLSSSLRRLTAFERELTMCEGILPIALDAHKDLTNAAPKVHQLIASAQGLQASMGTAGRVHVFVETGYRPSTEGAFESYRQDVHIVPLFTPTVMYALQDSILQSATVERNLSGLFCAAENATLDDAKKRKLGTTSDMAWKGQSEHETPRVIPLYLDQGDQKRVLVHVRFALPVWYPFRAMQSTPATKRLITCDFRMMSKFHSTLTSSGRAEVYKKLLRRS